jgi:hypothetical protein
MGGGERSAPCQARMLPATASASLYAFTLAATGTAVPTSARQVGLQAEADVDGSAAVPRDSPRCSQMRRLGLTADLRGCHDP